METILIIKVVNGLAIFAPGQAATMWKTLMGFGLVGFIFGMMFMLITIRAGVWYHKRRERRTVNYTVCGCI